MGIPDHTCKRCGMCCQRLMPDCWAKHGYIVDGIATCDLYGTDDFPEVCKDYPLDGVCYGNRNLDDR